MCIFWRQLLHILVWSISVYFYFLLTSTLLPKIPPFYLFMFSYCKQKVESLFSASPNVYIWFGTSASLCNNSKTVWTSHLVLGIEKFADICADKVKSEVAFFLSSKFILSKFSFLVSEKFPFSLLKCNGNPSSVVSIS